MDVKPATNLQCNQWDYLNVVEGKQSHQSICYNKNAEFGGFKRFLGTATAIAEATAAEASNQCKDAIEHNESQNTEKNDEISIHLHWYMINPLYKNSDPAQKPAKKKNLIHT